MPEIKIQRDTKVILSLTEHEAARLMDVLFSHTDFTAEPWTCEVYEALAQADIDPVGPPADGGIE